MTTKQTQLPALPTVTIGIPAYNEAANLEVLLPNLLQQKQANCQITQILVISDGSRDTTEQVVQKWAKRDSRLKCISHSDRGGKLKRLSEIYARSKTELIVIFDADMLPADTHCVEKLIAPFADPQVVMASANNQPLAGTTFFQRVLNTWSMYWYEVRTGALNTDTAHNARGCGVALRGSFVKGIAFSPKIVSDSKWLYFSAMQQGKKFRFVKEAVIYFRNASNLKDYLRQKNRNHGERNLLLEHFGSVVKEKHRIPFSKKIKAAILTFFYHPITTTAAFVLFLYLRFRPQPSKKTILKTGGWEVATSTKEAIQVGILPFKSFNPFNSSQKLVTKIEALVPVASLTPIASWLKKRKKTGSVLFYVALAIGLVSIITLATKGQKGVGHSLLYYQQEHNTQVEGPFESSNTTARYALTEAIVDQHTFFLNQNLAQFASPDVGEYKGKFTSLFTPGVSLLAIPFYIVGEKFGLQQFVTFFVTNIFAVIDLFLVSRAARKLGAGKFASLLSGFLFFCATDAFAYAFTLTQHIFSVTVLLLMFLNSLEDRTWVRDISFGALAGAAVLLDIPNILFALPMGFYILYRHFVIQQKAGTFTVSVKLAMVGIAIGVLPFAIGFAYYNKVTAGSFVSLAQTAGRSAAFKTADQVQLDAIENQQRVGYSVDPNSKESSIPSIFNTRRQLAGLYLLIFSDERGILYYSPIVIFGLLGMFLIYQRRQKQSMTIIMAGVILLTVMAYSMFSDPWGGWSFGPRYLIPAAAFLCVGIGIAFQKLKHNIIFIICFVAIAAYSMGINGLGAITTSAIPPKVEADNLATPLPHTYKYNLQLLDKNMTSSLVYNLFLEHSLTAPHYLDLLYLVLAATGLLIFIPALFEKEPDQS